MILLSRWWFPWHLRPKVSSASEEAESSMMVPAWPILGNQDQNHSSNGIIMGLPKLKIPKFLILKGSCIHLMESILCVSASPLIPVAKLVPPRRLGSFRQRRKWRARPRRASPLEPGLSEVLQYHEWIRHFPSFSYGLAPYGLAGMFGIFWGTDFCDNKTFLWIRNHSYHSYITHRIPIIPLVPVIAVAKPNMGNNLNSSVWTSLALYLSS